MIRDSTWRSGGILEIYSERYQEDYSLWRRSRVFNSLFLADHMDQEYLTLLSQELSSFNVGNDVKIWAKFDTICHEGLVRGEIETNSFSITKYINTIGAQLLHTKDNIKALY